MKKVLIYILSTIIIISGLLLFLKYFELNYDIEKYSLVNIYDIIKIENTNEEIKSNIYVVTTTKIKPTAIHCLKALIANNQTIERSETLSEETKERYQKVNDLFYQKNTSNGYLYTMRYLGKNVNNQKSSFYVFDVLENNENDFEVGDEILSIDNEEITSLREIDELISAKSEVEVKLIRNDEELTVKTKVLSLENSKSLGIKVFELPHYEMANITLNTNEYTSVSFSLELLEQLSNKKLSDKKILTIGKIEDDGKLYSVTHEEALFVMAINNNIDTIIIPTSSLDTFNEFKEKYNSDIEVLSFDTINDLLNYYE